MKAAWVHGTPYQGYARAMKVGREEILGMLVVESWVKRDHAAESKEWGARNAVLRSEVCFLTGPPRVSGET